jgi:hypothetical protein
VQAEVDQKEGSKVSAAFGGEIRLSRIELTMDCSQMVLQLLREAFTKELEHTMLVQMAECCKSQFSGSDVPKPC